jgi:hypothetical protein
MKVIICESKKGSWFAPIYSLFMGGQTAYPHGMIWNNGKLYDATFARGRFSEVEKVRDNRTIIVFDVEGDCQEWIDNNLGAKYDTIGVIFWFLGLHIEHHFYCYEILQRALTSVGVDLNIKYRVNGSKIIDALLNKGYEADIMQGKTFNERYLND